MAGEPLERDAGEQGDDEPPSSGLGAGMSLLHPDHAWVVTPEGKRVQLFEANGRYPATLRIPKAALNDLIEQALVQPLAIASDDNIVYELTPDGVRRGLETKQVKR